MFYRKMFKLLILFKLIIPGKLKARIKGKKKLGLCTKCLLKSEYCVDCDLLTISASKNIQINEERFIVSICFYWPDLKKFNINSKVQMELSF